MSVLVHNWNLPRYCEACPFKIEKCCGVLPNAGEISLTGRRPDCPLVSIQDEVEGDYPANCPCCGNPGEVHSFNKRQFRQGWVGCPKCGLYIQWKVSPVEALRKWNKRVCFHE